MAWQGVFLQALGCIGGSTALFLCYVLLLVIRAQPWWQPQYFIPMLGIMMGHTISGISVGLTALLEEFNSGAHLRTFFWPWHLGDFMWLAEQQLGLSALLEDSKLDPLTVVST